MSTNLDIYVYISSIYNNNPAAPSYGASSLLVDMILQTLRVSYQDFLDRGLIFTRNLLYQGFMLVKLKLSLRTFYGCQQHLVNSYRVSLSPDMTHIVHHVIVNIT